jgi:hypothetical protein
MIESIVVIIADANVLTPSGPRQPGLGGDSGERAVVLFR